MITLLNAAPDTGNQGVSALCLSALSGLAARAMGPLAVADHGQGVRTSDFGFAQVRRFGLTNHRRYWRGDNLRTVRRLAMVGGWPSASARTILASRAVLDVSGGDSFTDLYGPRRFRAMVETKRLALDNGLPLILLPQTLGPFRDPANLAEATKILRAAQTVWVRDAASFDFLREVLGTAFDPARHVLGLDMAVALPWRKPESLSPKMAVWLSQARGFPVAGMNVSGLLAQEADQARADFGLADRHDAQVYAAAEAILNSHPRMRLLLVPHVHRDPADRESDLGASLTLKTRLDAAFPDRVEVLTGNLGAMELKWVLSRLTWFAGARMHATIGAFSSGTPTLAFGYSNKAAGVFHRCGLGDHVADLRRLDAQALAQAVAVSLSARDAIRADLARRLPALRAEAEAQMDAIAAQIGC
ncbi:polysaccharide pyruvyl transferase family protein [Aliigemmobacter aestuarii]|uniref:Polysaccharide pyruvyl transferase family protein n=1 Tax=Aliigemmobacter aestuarii TaxID=1445661 RepID=A0A4S3ML62_9RHOB|nr:polysaccharide pyruvyl transferase family protein [Gemmobacter aestuarii]THD82310.1 polysaccharide pyruvyl transferase family protein [Gemmobacter aestuarii]